MKIAMLTNNYRPFVGGVPVSVERQAKALRALGHEVTVFAPDYGDGKNGGQDPEEDHVVRCSCFKRKMCNGMVYPKVADRQVREAFEREFFDCVHVHQPVFAGNTALKEVPYTGGLYLAHKVPGLSALFPAVPGGGKGGANKAPADPGGEGPYPAGLYALVHRKM